MSEENIHVDTLVTEDMSKDELYDYAKYLEYRKEELLNINHSLQQKVEQLEKENKKLKEDNVFLKTNLTKLSSKYIKTDLLNILNKGSEE